MNDAEAKIQGQGVIAYIKNAKHFLKEAELLHGQPLYFDKDGEYMDLVAELDRQIEEIQECYETGGVMRP